MEHNNSENLRLKFVKSQGFKELETIPRQKPHNTVEKENIGSEKT